MRIAIVLIGGLVGIFFILLGASYISWCPNYGLPFGYWGEYNGVKRHLSGIDGVTIINDWTHKDMTLEDFGFVVEVPGGDLVELRFYDGKATTELFRHAEGLIVEQEDRTRYLSLGDTGLGSTAGVPLRNAGDVLTHWGKLSAHLEGGTPSPPADNQEWLRVRILGDQE